MASTEKEEEDEEKERKKNAAFFLSLSFCRSSSFASSL